MLKEFIDFVDSVLPSVSPNFREGAKEAIYQFEKEGNQLNYLTRILLKDLSQGDIITNVPFSFFGEGGKQVVFNADAMVISTSCHIDQKEKLVLSPILPLNKFDGDLSALQKNTIYDFMYIPDTVISNKFISFEIFNTYNKSLIEEGINKGRISRVASLNQIGYYFFIIKLTVYLMRKEDEGTLLERASIGQYA